MVVADTPISEPSPVLALTDRLASPLDRFAAAVADFIILSPVAALGMAPFHKMAEEAQLQGRDDQSLFASVSAVGAAVLIFIVYQVFFLVKWRATPGKRIMGLTVEPLWQDGGVRLSPRTALLRSVAWCVEAMLFGVPWIAIVGNERRRAFHDRLSDTVVLTKQKSNVGPPGVHETALANGLVSAFFTALLIVVLLKVSGPVFGFKLKSLPGSFGTRSSSGGDLAKDSGSDSASSNDACDQIDHAEKNWIEGLREKKPSRMSIALALYESDAIDDECLRAEADSALWKSDEKDLSYLARGLTETTDEELSQTYLDKACTGDQETDACKALALLNDVEASTEHLTEQLTDRVDAKVARVQANADTLKILNSVNPQSEPFLKVIAIRHYSELGQASQALALIDAFSPQKDVSFFLSNERMKALWALDRKEESRSSMLSSISGFDSDQRVAMSRWLCHTETSEAGCSMAAQPSCDLLSASVEHDAVLFGDPQTTITYIRGETCARRLDEAKLAKLRQDMPDLESQNYVDALIALSVDRKKGVKALREIAAQGEEHPYFAEVQAKRVDLATNERELTSIRESWLDSNADSSSGSGSGSSSGSGEWVYLGRRLMERYNGFKDWNQTIEIGLKMGEEKPMDVATVRPLIVAAYRSGQVQLANGYLQAYEGRLKIDSSTRLPASQAGSQPDKSTASQAVTTDTFDQVVSELRQTSFGSTSGAK